MAVLSLQGLRTSANSACGVEGQVNGVPAGLTGLVIANGDKLVVDEEQNVPTDGGLALIFTNNTGTGNVSDMVSGTGLFFNQLTDGKWHHMAGSLTPFAGLTVSYTLAGIHLSTPNGMFNLQLANAAILHANGSVTPIFTGQSGTSVTSVSGANCGGQNLSSGTVVESVTDPMMATDYYVDDHLGTTQMETNGGGWPVWEGQFTPFGLELADGNTAMHYKFTGKERDTESGLDYFGARYYGSNMGRWMSPDWADIPVPIPYADPSNPQTLNLYGYAGNNPLSNVDPDGHLDCSGGANQDVACAVTTAAKAVWGWLTGGGSQQQQDNSTVTTQQQDGTAVQDQPSPFSIGNIGMGVGAMGALSAKQGWGNGTAGQANADVIVPRLGPDGYFLTTTTGSTKYKYSYDTHTGTQPPGTFVLGGYAGAGVHFTFGNGSVAQIKGPFKTINGNLSLGVEIGGFSYSYSGNVWQLTISPPALGVGLGAEFSKYQTNTCVKNGGDADANRP